jgi:diguanylate cyclase (GGDEF)-like protein
MPYGGADDTRATSELPAALLEARRRNAAAQSRQAWVLAAPVFPQARDRADWLVAAEAALLLARASGNLRDQAEALRWVHEAMQAAAAAGRADLVCAAWIEAARTHARDEDGASAQRAIDEALALVPQLASAEAIESAYSGLTAVYSELGLTGLAVACGRHALEYAELSHEVARVCMARTNFPIIGAVACEQALEPDPPLAQRLLAELRPQLERLRHEVPQVGTPLAQARLLRVAGALAVCEERWAEAADDFTQLTAYAGHLPPQLLSSAWIELGLVLRRLGQHEAALHSGRQAEACNPVPHAPRRWVDLRRLALIRDLTGESQEAFALLRRSQDRRHHIVMSALESRAAMLSARLDEQSLRLENEGLRRSNASLRASVADIARLAETDPLTGLLNRRGLEAAWAGLARPEGQQRLLGMVDIDHFKQVNDRNSHIVGDAVLRQVARLMSHELRGSDRMARYGGEEFAALVVGADPVAGTPVFERLRRVVEQHDWSRIAPGLRLSISIGVVRVARGESLEAAAARADKLLYLAKAAGRNRVLVDEGPGPGAEALA